MQINKSEKIETFILSPCIRTQIEQEGHDVWRQSDEIELKAKQLSKS